MAKDKHQNPPTTKPPPKLARLSKGPLPPSPFPISIITHKLTAPSDHRILKRPLLHPPIARPLTSALTPKTIYISTSSPFIALIKRARALLSAIEKRSSPAVDFAQHPDKVLKDIEAGVRGRGGREEVVYKATGRAIAKGLQVAMWWQGQEDVRVRIGTASVGAVDDVVGKDDGEGVGEVESRVRRTSCLEVGLSLR
jgi:ribonuclease P/MRP protein subunit POP7